MKSFKTQCKNIISKTKITGLDVAINPYVGCPHACIYCYAEFMGKFTSPDDKWGEFVGIKEFDTNLLSKFRQKYKGESVFLSSVTDCYNPFEARFKNTRKVLEEFANSDIKLQILTKSSLVLRDIDLFKTMPNLRVGLSVSFLDENLKALFEPRTHKISERLRALQILKEQGIKTFMFVAPTFPVITPATQIALKYADLADKIMFDKLTLYPSFRDKILAFIGRKFPDLLSLYKQIYLFNDNSYWLNLAQNLDEILSSKGVDYRIFFKN